MPGLTGGLFSLTAKGTLAKELVYFMRDGKQIVRDYIIPPDHKTDAQLYQRLLFQVAFQNWQISDPITQLAWKDYSKLNHVPGRYGYHWYLSRFIHYLLHSNSVLPQLPFLPQFPYQPTQFITISGVFTGNIELLNPDTTKIRIYSYTVQKLLQEIPLSPNQTAWNSQTLPAGRYSIKMQCPGSIILTPANYPNVYKFESGTLSGIDFDLYAEPTTISISGSLTGDISLFNGSNAKVEIKESNTQTLVYSEWFQQKQNAFLAANLQPGTYDILFAGTGFSTIEPIEYMLQECLIPGTVYDTYTCYFGN